MSTHYTGGCLCGAVRYEASEAPQLGGHCHCEDCRRSSGTGHCSHAMVSAEAVETTGSPSRFDKPADSGNMISRFFCGTCGAPVWSTNSALPHAIFLRASSLDDPEVFSPNVVVYTRAAPSWDVMDKELPAFETMPPDFPGEA